jgi:hypothetical protein
MIELILIIWLGMTNIVTLWFWFATTRKFAALMRLCENLVQALQAQRHINDQQSNINESLSENLEILGVHTKLIPPSIAMQAEAFLAWYNKRKGEKGNG